MKEGTKNCIWLTVDSPELERIVNQLGDEYSLPKFQPHCTLLGRKNISVERLKSAIIHLSNVINLKELTFDKISFGQSRWQSIYINFKEQDDITAWHQEVCAKLLILPKINYLPHLSLFYGILPISQKQKIIGDLIFPQKYKIKSLQITDCSGKVESWKSVYESKINL